MHSVKAIAQFLLRRGERLKGLSEKEINNIEQTFNVQIPKTYREFLCYMGREAGNYMKGSSVFYTEVFDLRNWTEELLYENGIEPLPADAFVFWMHQGYQAAYFKLSEGNDPPVYYYSESEQLRGFELKDKSLTNFFVWQLLMSYEDIDRSVFDNSDLI